MPPPIPMPPPIQKPAGVSIASTFSNNICSPPLFNSYNLSIMAKLYCSTLISLQTYREAVNPSDGNGKILLFTILKKLKVVHFSFLIYFTNLGKHINCRHCLIIYAHARLNYERYLKRQESEHVASLQTTKVRTGISHVITFIELSL
jgi:hypothetical protein